ncbi:MAG: 1-acyl-sn-glycerol-3-phosphate acyltransferase [Chitinophagaceae bacterium]|nr:1-acyl-sn-glycerol-3-phosphate acyltransferase [Chitinophagaceae bacterium]
MMRLFWGLFLRALGWKLRGQFPYHLKKCVVIVGPHTSSWDFVIGLAMRSRLRLTHARFLGKAELFRPPFGFFFRSLGGIPVNRSQQTNMVDQVVDVFSRESSLVLAMAPEGTRKKVDRLRTGFYFIAKKAGVPIVMAGLDFGKKELLISEPFMTSEDEAADFEHIHRFFAGIEGKIPGQGLGHLSL